MDEGTPPSQNIVEMIEDYAAQKVEKALERIYKAYPAVFPYEVQYGQAIMKHGKYTPLALVRLNEDEEEMLKNIVSLIMSTEQG